MAVIVETTLGDLTVDLFVEERPRACLNFLKLCKLKYYNYNLFHNVERDFIAQTGDPSGDGDGGESVWGVVEGSHKRYFEAESLPKIKHTIPGLVSLVSVGKNLVGSQFFFTLGSDLTSLDGIHCVIGEVAEGHDVLRKLNEAIVDEKYRPYQDIRITHTVILEDPFDDPRGFQVPSRSPSPSAERLKNGRIGADEDINDTDGKTEKEIHEILQEREAKARATILEIVGDLPDADIAPPENVLFVCKLNPVTTDDDLEIIFSRFGKVKSCEVIKDKYTGDSLQYAFVEFEDKKACENAYFKMDNVLIDDRRIHVDFSQSVAKVKWRGKGRGVVHQNSNKKIDFDNLREDKDRKRSPISRDRRRDKDFQREKSRNQEANIYRDREHRYNYNRQKQISNRERFIENRKDIDRSRYSRKYEVNERHRSRSPKHRSREDTRNSHVDRERARDKSEKSNEKRRKKESKRSSKKSEKKSKKHKRKQRSSSTSSNSSSEVRRKKQQKETIRRPSTSSNSSSSSD